MYKFLYKVGWYRFKNACKWFAQAWKMPRRVTYKNPWGEGSHEHICLALRLLNADVFKLICPEREEAEWSDSCDKCPFMAKLDYPRYGIMILDINDDILCK